MNPTTVALGEARTNSSLNDKYIDVNDDDGSLDRSRDEGEGVTVTTQIKVPAVTPENTAHVASAGQVEPPLSSNADRASTPGSEGDGNVKGHPDDDPSDAAVVIVVTPESPLAATKHQPSKTQHTQAKAPRPKKAPRRFLAWFGCFGGRAVVDDHADHGDARERRLVSTKSDAGIISDNLAPAKQLDGRRRVSVTALDKTTLVDLDEDELAEIKTTHVNCDGAFTEAELSHLYADYKLNGKAITQQDFTIIFDTFSRTSSGMADLMFGMYDQDRSGSLAFDGLARALAVFLKGTYEEKVELCFQLLDTDNDSHITRNDLVSMLKYLPMQRIKRQNDALLGSSMMGNGKDLQLRTLEEEEETEEGEVKMQKKWQQAREKSSRVKQKKENLPYRDAMLASFVADDVATIPNEPSTLSMRRRAESKRIRKRTDAKNENVAAQVVDEAFSQLQLPRKSPITLEQFRWVCEATEIAQYLIPL
eukprot:m.58028 g.58028  ORF g.58028 m.58028 type:complete len:477 (+) comp17173_c0_seq1:134-1564(+)